MSNQWGSRRPRRTIDGDEVDAVTPWRRFLYWRSGVRKKTKRRMTRRERREGRREILEGQA